MPIAAGSFTPALCALALLFVARPVSAAPFTGGCPEEDRTVLRVRSARALVAEHCDCGSVRAHARYVRCAKRTADRLARDGRLSRSCRRVVVAFERASACGQLGAAVCCRRSIVGGVKAAVSGAGRCERRGGLACGRCDGSSSDACAHSVYDACMPDATCADADADGGGPAGIHPHLLPSKEQLLGWIEAVFAQ